LRVPDAAQGVLQPRLGYPRRAAMCARELDASSTVRRQFDARDLRPSQLLLVEHLNKCSKYALHRSVAPHMLRLPLSTPSLLFPSLPA
jgi:hypothetical protein